MAKMIPLLPLFSEGFFPLLGLTLEQQTHLTTALPGLRLHGEILEKLFDQCIAKLVDSNLVTSKQQRRRMGFDFSGSKQAKAQFQALKRACFTYSWIGKFSDNEAFCQLKLIDRSKAPLRELFAFERDLQKIFFSGELRIADTTATDATIRSTATVPTSPPIPTPTQAEREKNPSAMTFRSHPPSVSHYRGAKRANQPEKKQQKSKGNPKIQDQKSNRQSRIKRDHPLPAAQPSKVEQAEKRENRRTRFTNEYDPIPYQPMPFRESALDLDAFIKVEERAVPQHGDPFGAISAELTALKMLAHQRKSLSPLLQGVLNQSPLRAFQLLDLAMMGLLSPTHRGLFLSADGKVMNHDIYKLDCSLIHGIHDFIHHGMKEESSLYHYVNGCYKPEHVKLSDMLHRSRQVFYQQIQQSSKNRDNPEAILVRLQVIQFLLEVLRDCHQLLKQEDPINFIGRQALRACLSILGEQIARLQQVDPFIYAQLQSSAIGDFLQRCRQFRNLRHGVNTDPTTEVQVQIDDAFEIAVINTAEDWPELERRHRISLEADLVAIQSVAGLLQALIDSKTMHIPQPSFTPSHQARRRPPAESLQDAEVAELNDSMARMNF